MTMTAPLRRVLLRAPGGSGGWERCGWRAEPDAASDGAILLNPGKACRRAEPAELGEDLERADVPVAGRLEGAAHAEGGDLIRLDERTLLAGRGYRTNDEGIEALRRLLPDVDVLVFDLPHWHGRGEVMHLLSLLSPLADDLVVAYPPLLPVRLAELLEEREIEVVPVPDEEFDTMGANVLALAPRVALAVGGNPETRRRRSLQESRSRSTKARS